ncbi:MAG: acetyl-CoA carboxylase biotin carboxyl carrier protein subunit [Cytophagaceae bacterium]|jgi:acetyl/propionyl-CoA carboxylase alpha subunit|nr:acetyl-CoA carboxylase biotin carboxyl carrier protein subunit [Cytophagaceae bacterium]
MPNIIHNDLSLNVDPQGLNPDLQVLPKGPGEYTVIFHHQVYRIRLEDLDGKGNWRVYLNDKIAEVEWKEDIQVMLDKLGMNAQSLASAKEIKAPMPGLLLDIPVHVGQHVLAGQVLMILEAMKMENLIKSPIEGTISSIEVQKGNKVEKNQLLLRFE